MKNLHLYHHLTFFSVQAHLYVTIVSTMISSQRNNVPEVDKMASGDRCTCSIELGAVKAAEYTNMSTATRREETHMW